MAIGRKIKEFGKKKFPSMREFAEALGIKREQLYPYFNGKVLPGSEFLLKLKNLGCDINWLLSEDDNPPPETDALVKKRLADLEEENQRLRDSISRMVIIANQIEKKDKPKRRKK